jgi:hypothetical protein
MDALTNALFIDRVPNTWGVLAYPSLKGYALHMPLVSAFVRYQIAFVPSVLPFVRSFLTVFRA